MQSLIVEKTEILKLSAIEIEEIVLISLGLKVEVVKNENKTFVLLKSYQSCFRLMERLHWDFEFSVHKKDKKYIIEI